MLLKDGDEFDGWAENATQCLRDLLSSLQCSFQQPTVFCHFSRVVELITLSAAIIWPFCSHAWDRL